MEGMFYNVKFGYLEGIVRGYRNTLLTGQNYNNLTQCETIDGMPHSKGSNWSAC
jgi:V-type H+-transporting ATPase subunit d